MSSKEHRSVNRKPLALRASVLCDETRLISDSIPVRTLDLSNRGALIESPEEMFVNQVCTFNLITSDARNVQVQGRIVWVKTAEKGVYHAGVAFRNLSADEEYWISLQLIRG